ncbi:MAG: indole-3-glycerol phosphate synthase TrpC [Bacteroidia bacterium]|nr:indole-3-glycerol phosphate synthase TrpC [Bacteroidia bacterium]
MTILDHIVANKYREVEEHKSLHPVNVLEKSIFFRRRPLSLKDCLLPEDQFGIIAEFKRRSPSGGIINEYALAEKVCCEYIQAGSSAVSVLTDSKFFGGSSADLMIARKFNDCPVLCKDFIVDEYQIIEARSIGADAILLITGLHQPDRIEQLHKFARSLDLEVLVEVHDENDFSMIPHDAQLVGINSRNLASLRVDHEILARLVHLIPRDVVKVAESGIKSPSDYLKLKNAGFNGFLIGELFMNSPDPGKTCRTFITELKQFGVLSVKNEQN